MIPNPYDLEWKVEADEEFKGSHPYHDNRFITQGDGDDAIIIARMSDMPLQKEYATLIAASPRLLKALQCICARIKGEFDNPVLLEYGSLGMTHDDVLAIAQAAIAEVLEGR